MKLWKENKIANEWSLPNKEIADRFCKSDYFKDCKEGMPLDRMLPVYIAAKDGLNSVWAYETEQGKKDYDEISWLILDIWENKQ